jgi:hypothetical protein
VSEGAQSPPPGGGEQFAENAQGNAIALNSNSTVEEEEERGAETECGSTSPSKESEEREEWPDFGAEQVKTEEKTKKEEQVVVSAGDG